MTDRQIFEKETGYSIQDDCYTNNHLGLVSPEDYWKVYALWLESRKNLLSNSEIIELFDLAEDAVLYVPEWAKQKYEYDTEIEKFRAKLKEVKRSIE